jgi:hypothetical protein
MNHPIFFNSNNNFNHLHPFDPFNKSIQFGNLHNDILNYSRKVTENIIGLKGIKLAIIKKIEEYIKEILSEYNISLILYGSYATDLEIESSDIDVTLKYTNKNENDFYRINQSYMSQNYSIELIISRIVKSFTLKNIFDVVNPIYTASVPIIKLVIIF